MLQLVPRRAVVVLQERQERQCHDGRETHHPLVLRQAASATEHSRPPKGKERNGCEADECRLRQNVALFPIGHRNKCNRWNAAVTYTSNECCISYQACHPQQVRLPAPKVLKLHKYTRENKYQTILTTRWSYILPPACVECEKNQIVYEASSQHG